MRRLILLALGAAALSGCTGSHIKKPPVCDGKHKRDANIYGTILPELPVPLPPSQQGGQAGQSLVAPPSGGDAPSAAPGQAGAAPPKTSARDVRLSYLNC